MLISMHGCMQVNAMHSGSLIRQHRPSDFTGSFPVSLLLGTRNLGLSTNICICMRADLYVAAVNCLFFTETYLPWSKPFANPCFCVVVIYESDFFSRWMLDYCTILPAESLKTTQIFLAGITLTFKAHILPSKTSNNCPTFVHNFEHLMSGSLSL